MIPKWWEKYHSVSACLFQKCCHHTWWLVESAARSREEDSSSVSLETAIISNGILLWIWRKAEKVKISERVLLHLYILLQQKGSALLHDFVLYLWILLSKEIQTKWPSCGESYERSGWETMLSSGIRCHGNADLPPPADADSTELLQYAWFLITWGFLPPPPFFFLYYGSVQGIWVLWECDNCTFLS